MTAEEIDQEEVATVDEEEPAKKKHVSEQLSPPGENPHHCPKCGTIGKYVGRQHQSEKYMLIAWKADCGNAWSYIYPHDKLPDATTLV
jgi:hypothetical protein